MDPLDRADALLSRARARGTFVVTPDTAESPMDASRTVRLHRAVVSDAEDPDTTTRLPQDRIRAQDGRQHHLAESTPTVPLAQDSSGPPPADPQADTPPQGIPRADAAGTERACRGQEDGEQPLDLNESDDLVPTITRTQESRVARRLDGE
jgi:hypothetical protein